LDVWLVRGVLAFARPHMARLFEAAKSIDMDLGITFKVNMCVVYMCLAVGQHMALSGMRFVVTWQPKP
jgi:hypothetical protein